MLPPSTQTAARWAKILLLAAIALFFTLVAFTNITDFDTNYQFVRHVLAMDTPSPTATPCGEPSAPPPSRNLAKSVTVE